MNDYSNERAIDGYLALQREQPELFRNVEGGIEILSDRRSIELAQNEARRLRTSGSDTRAGVLASDPYMTVLRDPVRFPDGRLGLYNRILEGQCVAVLPMLADKLVLIRIYRHGLRDWTLEFPRGSCEPGEEPDHAARRELLEEIGAQDVQLTPLGDFSPGGSSLAIHAQLFAAQIAGIGQPDQADAISEILLTCVDEVERMIVDARIIDGFSMSLFARARLVGLI